MEAWIEKYPSQFADSMTRIYLAAEFGNSAAEGLARKTLNDARETLESSITALGLEWISPQTGDPITTEHEVIREEAGAGDTNTVAHLARRGFRLRGKQYLAAQVSRFAAATQTKESFAPTVSAALAPAPLTALSAAPLGTLEVKLELLPASDILNSQGANLYPALTQEAALTPSAEVWPEWYQSLQRKSVNCSNLAALQVIEVLDHLYKPPVSASDSPLQNLTRSLEFLLPLFGTRANLSRFNLPPEWEDFLVELRPSLDDWLMSALDIGVVAPGNNVPFDPVLMEPVGIRPTAHPQTRGTVAKLEQAGLTYQGQPLFRAKVIRYELGENG